MAQKFGGAYSPGGSGKPSPSSQNDQQSANQFTGKKVKRSSVGLKMLSVAAGPMLVAGILEIGSGDAVQFASELGAFALMATGIWLTREGLQAEAAFNERSVARAPGIPRKLFGAVALGLGVGLGAASGWGLGIVQGVLYGGIAIAAHLTAFGFDPMRAKGLAEQSDFERDRVMNAVDKAEGLLAELTAQAAGIPDRGLRDRVDSLASAAREMFRKVENDPNDLPRSRKYLGVYLTGARDATAKYAELARRGGNDASARSDYLQLLDDLEAQFRAQGDQLLLNDRSELDIEIEVLRDRLQQEGVRPRT